MNLIQCLPNVPPSKMLFDLNEDDETKTSKDKDEFSKIMHEWDLKKQAKKRKRLEEKRIKKDMKGIDGEGGGGEVVDKIKSEGEKDVDEEDEDLNSEDIKILENTAQYLIKIEFIRNELLLPYLPTLFDKFPSLSDESLPIETLLGVIVRIPTLRHAVLHLPRQELSTEDHLLLGLQRPEIIPFLDFSGFTDEHFILLAECSAVHAMECYKLMKLSELNYLTEARKDKEKELEDKRLELEKEKKKLEGGGESDDGEDLDGDSEGVKKVEPDTAAVAVTTESQSEDPVVVDESDESLSNDLKGLFRSVQTISEKTRDIAICSISQHCKMMLTAFAEGEDGGNQDESDKDGIKDSSDPSSDRLSKSDLQRIKELMKLEGLNQNPTKKELCSINEEEDDIDQLVEKYASRYYHNGMMSDPNNRILLDDGELADSENNSFSIDQDMILNPRKDSDDKIDTPLLTKKKLNYLAKVECEKHQLEAKALEEERNKVDSQNALMLEEERNKVNLGKNSIENVTSEAAAPNAVTEN